VVNAQEVSWRSDFLLQALLEGSRCSWTDAAKSSHPMSCGVVCSPSLSEGMSSPEVVGPPLVEKDQVLRGCILFTCREKGDRLFHIVMPC
jgi:hypothetical protein